MSRSGVVSVSAPDDGEDEDEKTVMTQSPISDSQLPPRLSKSRTAPRIRKKDGLTSTGISSIRKPISVADLSSDSADLFSSLDLPPLQGSEGEDDLMTMIAPSAKIHPGSFKAANETAPPSSRPATAKPASRPSISDHQSLSFPRASRSFQTDAPSHNGTVGPRSVGSNRPSALASVQRQSMRPESAPAHLSSPGVSSHGLSMSGVSRPSQAPQSMPGMHPSSFAPPAYPYPQQQQQQYNSAQYSSHGITGASNHGISDAQKYNSYPPPAYPMQQPAHLQQPQPMVIPQSATSQSQMRAQSKSGGAWTGLFVVAGIAVAVAAGLMYTKQTDAASRPTKLPAAAAQAPQAAEYNEALAPQAAAPVIEAALPQQPAAQPAQQPVAAQPQLPPGAVAVPTPAYAQQSTQVIQPQVVQPQVAQPHVSQPAAQTPVAQNPVAARPAAPAPQAPTPAARRPAATGPKVDAKSADKKPDAAEVARGLLEGL